MEHHLILLFEMKQLLRTSAFHHNEKKELTCYEKGNY